MLSDAFLFATSPAADYFRFLSTFLPACHIIAAGFRHFADDAMMLMIF